MHNPRTSHRQSLDPENWDTFREQSHHMLDDMIDYLEHLRERPVWQPAPDELRARFREPMPSESTALETVHHRFMQEILPYAVGNAHPGFMGWVHGGGTPVGMLADMLAAGLNANLGGRNQMPIEVEKQVLHWVRELFKFPETASGLFVTGASLANFIALLVARTATLGERVRQDGVGEQKLVAYTSTSAHGCITQAMELAGFGSSALRQIPADERFRMDTQALAQAIAADRKAGLTPFFIAATAGTVDVGAIDDLDAIADLAQREHVWLHIDGALGALGMMSPDIAPRLAGIGRADSIAFDFHKWGQVPYDAGFILVRDGDLHRHTFAAPAAYLRRETRGMAAGSPWPCDFGPDLSRGFRALKVWFTLKTFGSTRMGEMISGTCELARYLAERIIASPELELLAPVSLNIVCFRYRFPDADQEGSNRLNARLVIALQESGLVAPSTTMLHGILAIRVAIVNHRTEKIDIDKLLEAALTRAAMMTRVTIAPTASSNEIPQGSPLIGQAAFTRMALAGTDLTPLGQQLLKRAEDNPADANCLIDLSTVLLLCGNHSLSLDMQRQALAMQQIYRLPMHRKPVLRLLALMAPGDMMANTPLEFLLENSDIELTMLFIGHDLPLPTQLPEHDVLFVAIGESDANQPTLVQLQDVLPEWPRPVLNMPDRIAQLSRDRVCQILEDTDGVSMPPTLRLSRLALAHLDNSAEFPLIVRPVDSHAGQGLEKLDAPADLANYLDAMPQQEFFLSRFIDYRSDDGLFRKYRIVLISGKPYLAHLAISDHWMIHYLNAGMEQNPEKRREESLTMSGFGQGFARKHHAALQSIHQRMGLDYIGLDCAETRDGKLLVFEADTSMVVHAMDAPELFPYKQQHMRKVFDAFRSMLLLAAARHTQD